MAVEPIGGTRSAALEWWRSLQNERCASEEARGSDSSPVQADAEKGQAPPPTAVADTPSAKRDELTERELKRRGLKECEACKARRYVDGSNDMGVSFKSPGYISPGASAAIVRAHESEHVGREQARAGSEGRDVVAQSVQLFTSTCPECGRVFVSGGKTTTMTQARRQPLDFYA